MQSLFLLLKLILVVSLTLTLVNAHGGQEGRPKHGRHRPSRRSSPPPGSRPHPTSIPSYSPHFRSPPGSRRWPSHAHYTRTRPTHHSTFMKSKGSKPGKKKRFFSGVIRLLIQWTNSYSDRTSAKHRNLVQTFYTAMKNVFPKEKELVNIKVESLRKGSVIVDFTLVLSSSGSAKAVQIRLEKKIRNGKFGNMKVDKKSLKINEIESPKHQAHKKGKHYLYHEFNSAIIVLALVLVCLCAGIGTWYYLKGKNPKKERDVMQEFDNPIKFPQASVA